MKAQLPARAASSPGTIWIVLGERECMDSQYHGQHAPKVPRRRAPVSLPQWACAVNFSITLDLGTVVFVSNTEVRIHRPPGLCLKGLAAIWPGEFSMTDDKSDGTPTNPEELASLYSWANLEATKYRDFSYGRAEPRTQSHEMTGRKQVLQEVVQQDVLVNAERIFRKPQSPAVSPSSATGTRLVIGEITSEDAERERGSPSEQPAWLRGNPATPATAPTPPAEALQQLRERVASRWFALKGVFDQATDEGGPPNFPEREIRVPHLGVFSLAGGVGKTSIVATLGRALSGYGERVLLVDGASYGLLPFYFGARELRPGNVRTFSPPGGSTDAPIHLVSVEREGQPGEGGTEDSLTADLRRFGRGSNRVLVDLATGSGPLIRRFLSLNPTLLVPIGPDMNSVVSLGMLDAFFRRHADVDAHPVKPYFVLNHFDASLPLHLDVREVLREELGDRLLPFVLRRSSAVSEALAEGMTVMDYAPDSPVAEDFMTLANWIRNTTAPAPAGFRGVRWSER